MPKFDDVFEENGPLDESRTIADVRKVFPLPLSPRVVLYKQQPHLGAICYAGGLRLV